MTFADVTKIHSERQRFSLDVAIVGLGGGGVSTPETWRLKA